MPFAIGDFVLPKPGADTVHIQSLVSKYAGKKYAIGCPLKVVSIRNDSFGGPVLETEYAGERLPAKWASRFVKLEYNYIPPSKEELLIKKIQQLYNRQKYVVEGVAK